jgi:hypothetical protein
MSVIITDIETRKPASPDMQKAINNGRIPAGATHPPVFLCGHCHAYQVADGEGICFRCRAMFDLRAIYTGMPWTEVAWVISVSAILFGLLIWIFSIFK